MRTGPNAAVPAWCSAILSASLVAPPAGLAQTPLGTAITYQGHLRDNGTPFDGSADLVFRLYDAPSGGTLLGSQALNATPVVNGLFTVQLNAAGQFGPDAFDGNERWLEVQVNGTPLAPRQPLTAAPYALYALDSPGAGLWVASGNDMHNANSGNVGIGTSSPQHRLHVAGDLRAEARIALGNDAWFGLGGGAYPEFDRVHDLSHVITDFSTSPYWSPLLSVVTLDPTADLTNGEQIYGNSFETHVAGPSTRGFDFVIGLYGAAVHKGSGQGGNLLGGLVFSGPQGPGNLLRNYGLAVDAGGSWGSTATITENIGLSIVTGHWGDAGSVQRDTGLLVQTPQAFHPIDAHYGIYLEDQNVAQTTNYAIYAAGGDMYLNGDLEVTGTLSKGGGSFRIDHPLDPQNKYLLHSFVESPDMMNIYNGIAVTGDDGLATIELPAWFQALNRDFRYQLTVIDSADAHDFPLVKVVREILDNRFTIRSSTPGVRVSWQVTGIRQDKWAQANRIPVELDKPADRRGTYLHPQAYGRPLSSGMSSPSREPFARGSAAGSANAASAVGGAAPIEHRTDPPRGRQP